MPFFILPAAYSSCVKCRTSKRGVQMTDTFGELPDSNSEPIVNGGDQKPESASKKSTGPRTSQGKRRSSKNAIRHGFFSKEIADLHMLDKKDRKAYLKLLAGLCEKWKPVDISELIQVELMATHLHHFKCVFSTSRSSSWGSVQ